MEEISVSKTIYSKESVLRAGRQFLNDYYVSVEEKSGDLLLVKLTQKDSAKERNATVREVFLNQLLFEQIKEDAEKKYHNVRDELYRAAFGPLAGKNE